MELTDRQKQVWWENSFHKMYRISFLDSDIDDIGNSRLYSESMVFTDTLCDDEDIIFGRCCSAQFEIQVADLVEDIKGLEMSVYIECGGIEIPLGIFVVYSVEKTSNRRYKKIIAYDRMIYLKENVSDWYKSILPAADSIVTLKQFRDSFFEYMNIEQEDIELINDDMLIRKTIDTNKISGIEIMQSVCEINGVFGHINRYGKFTYINLKFGGLYPAVNLYPAKDLYPSSRGEPLLRYIESDYEEYYAKGINRIQIRQEEEDIGYISDSSYIYEGEENDYIVTGNPLMYGMSEEELKKYGDRLLNKIKGFEYKPAKTQTIGLPYFELGEIYSVYSRYDNFESVVLKHTLSGGQSLRSEFEANGNEFRTENIDGLNYQFQQLKGKSNKLTRTVEKTISELTDLENNTESRFIQTAESIESEVNRAKAAEGDLSSKITQTAEGINISVDKQISDAKTYAEQQAQIAQNNANSTTDEKLKSYPTSVQMQSEIGISAENIRSEVSITYETKTDAGEQYNNLSSSIEQNATAITTKVSKGTVSSEISQEAEQVTISGNRLVVDADNFSLTAQGKISCGDGEIGGLKIGSEGLSDAAYGTYGLRILKDGQIYCNNIIAEPADAGTTSIVVRTSDNSKIKAISPYAFSGRNGDYYSYLNDIGLQMTYGAYSNKFQATQQYGECTATNAYVKTDINQGNISASGTGYFGAILAKNIVATEGKNKLCKTKNYGDRLMYSTEAPEPLFTDRGRGIINNGQCIIALNPVFLSCISESADYDVFLTKYGQGDLWVEEIQPAFFIVKGVENLKFVWKIEAVQKECENIYLNAYEETEILDMYPDVNNEVEKSVIELEAGL